MMEMHQQPRNSVTFLYTIEEASGLASISRIPTGEQSEAEVTWHEETVVDTFETVNIHTWTSGRLCQCPKRVLGSSCHFHEALESLERLCSSQHCIFTQGCICPPHSLILLSLTLGNNSFLYSLLF